MKRKAPKQRNPFVQHLITKKQGVHGKTKKAERRRQRVALAREWK